MITYFVTSIFASIIKDAGFESGDIVIYEDWKELPEIEIIDKEISGLIFNFDKPEFQYPPPKYKIQIRNLLKTIIRLKNKGYSKLPCLMLGHQPAIMRDLVLQNFVYDRFTRIKNWQLYKTQRRV